MVDHEIDGYQRVDLFGVAAEGCQTVAHCGEIDHGRNAGEVLHKDAGRAVSDFTFDLALVGQPFGDRQDVLLGDRLAIFKAQQVFQQHLHGKRQLGNARETVLFGLDQAEINIILATHGQGAATVETI